MLKEHKNTAKSIRENDINLAKITSGITQLEKFNTKSKNRNSSLSKGSISDADTEKLKNLKDTFAKIDEQRKHLKEEKSYIDAIRLILQDTGIKTKIIKQYLPVMNNLINKYLTSMSFMLILL